MSTNHIENFFISNLDIILKVVPAVAGVAAALFNPQVRKLFDFIIKPVTAMFMWVFYPFRLPFIIMEQNTQILKELYPNGGGSLRDAINQLHMRQTMINDRLLNIMDHDKTPIFETDSNGAIVWVNNAYIIVTGRPMQELLGYGWINGVYEPDRERVSTQWDLAIEEKRTFELTYSYQNIDGSVYTAFVRATPVRSSGQLVGWTGYVTLLDVSPPESGQPTDSVTYSIQHLNIVKSGKKSID